MRCKIKVIEIANSKIKQEVQFADILNASTHLKKTPGICEEKDAKFMYQIFTVHHAGKDEPTPMVVYTQKYDADIPF